MNPWPTGAESLYGVNLGNNSLSKIEIVSSLNCFNIANRMYHYYDIVYPQKYNPKVYFGAIQTLADQWIYDNNSGRKSGLEILPDETQKSGSWPL